MSIKGLEMLREHMSYYDFNPDSVLLLGNVLYYLKQAEGEVAELESENKKIRELVRELWKGYADPHARTARLEIRQHAPIVPSVRERRQ